MNTFIKFKDEAFFESTVRPFIKNKLNKNIVDYCLLEEDQAADYADLNKYRTLNAFEKSLLVWLLIKKGNKQ